MSDNILKIVPKPIRINKETIEALRNWLNMAENGNVFGVAIIGISADGLMMHEHTECDDMPAMIYGLDLLRLKCLMTRIEEAKPVEDDA